MLSFQKARNSMRWFKFAMILMGLNLIFSCTASRVGNQRPVAQGQRSGSRYVEDFDPLTLRDDDIEVPPPADAVEAQDEPEESPLITPTDEDRMSGETVQGFRVQLLATRDEIQANEVKKSAIFSFEEGVYLVFEAPYFRLRIGDCRTRNEAEVLRDEAVEKGFDDAWIVPAKVFVKSSRDMMN
jgi:hypothetical protein